MLTYFYPYLILRMLCSFEHPRSYGCRSDMWWVGRKQHISGVL